MDLMSIVRTRRHLEVPHESFVDCVRLMDCRFGGVLVLVEFRMRDSCG